MKRIAIIGSTGSGKSTLAKRLGAALDLHVTELDSLHWLPGWVERDTATFRALVDKATRGERWITEGGYSEVRDLVWGRADTIVWLNLPFRTNLWQLFRRTVRRARTGSPVCNGNVETWQHSFFSNDSVLLWLFKSYWRNLERFPKALEEYSKERQIVILRSRNEMESFVASVSSNR
ncbi:MAG: adenylate kinase [Casimicrobium sp.]